MHRRAAAPLVGLVALFLAAAFRPTLADETSLAIGRLNHAGYKHLQHCTATLVAPRAAVTALHCLARGEVSEMHLLLGYDRGSWHEHLRPVTAASTPSAGDIAVLCLDKPSTVEPLAIAARPVERGESVLVVGYGKPTVHVANSKSCRVRRAENMRALELDCPLSPGDSGAPVLRETDMGAEIVGIVSATNANRSLAYTFDRADWDAACSPARQGE